MSKSKKAAKADTINNYLRAKQHFQKGGLKTTVPFKDTGFGKSFGNGTFAAGAQVGSSIFDMAAPGDEYGVQDDGAALGKGALSGAATGAAAGPVGAVVGAFVGGAASLIENSANKKKKADAMEKKRQMDYAKALQESQQIQGSYENDGSGITSFQQGGVLVSYPGGYGLKSLKYKPTSKSFNPPNMNFQEGGLLPAGNGDLKPVSANSDAVEVKGDNPGATDDVIIEGAAVDHNEIIKPTPEGMKIYSDTLKVPGTSKTFSKWAKTIEKQKTSDENRFPKQNQLVETKMNRLFNLQQAINGNNMGETSDEALRPAGETEGAGFSQADGSMFKRGGILSPVSRYYHKITPEAIGMKPGNYYGSMIMGRNPQQVLQETMYKQSTPNPVVGRYQTGGLLHAKHEKSSLKPKPDVKPAQSTGVEKETWVGNMKKSWNGEGKYQGVAPSSGRVLKTYQTGGFSETSDYESGIDESGIADTPVKKKKFSLNLGKIDGNRALNSAATLAPVFANMLAAGRVPNVPQVRLNNAINLKRVRNADQMNMLNQGLRTASLSAQQNSVNPNAQQAGMGNAQAQYGNQVNQAFGDLNRANSQISNQEMLYNSQIQGINNQKLDQYAAGETARAANILNLKSATRADLSNKILAMSAEENKRKRDIRSAKMQQAWLNKLAPGVYDRNQFLNAIDPADREPEEVAKSKNKNGGIVYRGRKMSKLRPC